MIHSIVVKIAILEEKNNTIRFVWIPAHQDREHLQRSRRLRMNNIADKLTRDVNAPSTNWRLPCTRKEIKRELQTAAVRKLNKWWDKRTNGTNLKYTRFFKIQELVKNRMLMKIKGYKAHNQLRKIGRKYTHQDMTHLSRRNFFKYTSFITSISFLRSHMKYLTRGESSDLCRGCGMGPENPQHLIGRCQAFGRTRLRIFGHSEFSIEDIDFDPRKIISFINSTKIKEWLERWDEPYVRRARR